MTTKPEDIARLGRAVHHRRTALGMTQDDVKGAGGPSDVTVRNIENGSLSRINAATLGKLDNALQWEPGTASAHLRGEAEKAVSPAPAPVYLHDASDSALLAEIARRFDLTRSHRDRIPAEPVPADHDLPVADQPQLDGATPDTGGMRRWSEARESVNTAKIPLPDDPWRLAANRGSKPLRDEDRRAAERGEESQDPGTDEPA